MPRMSEMHGPWVLNAVHVRLIPESALLTRAGQIRELTRAGEPARREYV